jgi:hypothetical protein
VPSQTARALCRISAVALLAFVLATPSVASGPPTTQTFSTPRGPYTFTVPAGVSSVHVEAIGGAGGAFGSYARGNGAGVSADLPVTPGQSL